jgi:2-methylisocitrate lyase-like PEP mutase family enzyme
MDKNIEARRTAFRTLHERGHFVIPNPWDIGGIRHLEQLGFKALASTSAGYAWSLGRQDGELTRDEVLEHLRTLCLSTELPINADFEAGFADQPEEVAANVLLAVETGVAGLSLEDRTGQELYPLSLAEARIRAARQAIDNSGQDVLLIGRTEGLLIGKTSLDQAIERLVAYSNAGADVLYAPGVIEIADIRAIVEAVAPKPVNVLLRGSRMNVADLAAAGVRRISVGSTFAAAAWARFDEYARSVRDEGHLPLDKKDQEKYG